MLVFAIEILVTVLEANVHDERRSWNDLHSYYIKPVEFSMEICLCFQCHNWQHSTYFTLNHSNPL
jgi:hypothetical protein